MHRSDEKLLPETYFSYKFQKNLKPQEDKVKIYDENVEISRCYEIHAKIIEFFHLFFSSPGWPESRRKAARLQWTLLHTRICNSQRYLFNIHLLLSLQRYILLLLFVVRRLLDTNFRTNEISYFLTISRPFNFPSPNTPSRHKWHRVI